MINCFGPHRKAKNEYSDICPSNAFIGNYLRLDILFRYGLSEKALDEMDSYFTYMAEKTGTLWENCLLYTSLYAVDTFLPKAAGNQLPDVFGVYLTEVDKIVSAGYAKRCV